MPPRRDVNGQPFKMITAREQRRFSRTLQRAWLELNQHRLGRLESAQDDGNDDDEVRERMQERVLDARRELRPAVESRDDPAHIVSYEKDLFCKDLLLELGRGGAVDPFARVAWEPEKLVLLVHGRETWDIKTRSEMERERAEEALSEDDDILLEDSPSTTTASLFGPRQEGAAPVGDTGPGSDSSDVEVIDEGGAPVAGPSGSGSGSRSSGSSPFAAASNRAVASFGPAGLEHRGFARDDSGEDTDASDLDDPRSQVAMSEKRRGKLRETQQESDAEEDMQLPTPSRSLSVPSKPAASQAKPRRPPTTTTAAGTKELPQPQIDLEEESAVDLRGKKVVRRGGAKSATTKRKVRVVRVRTAFNPKRHSQLKPNPDSEAHLREYFASDDNTTKKMVFDLHEYEITSCEGPIDLVDLFDLASGFEISGLAAPVVVDDDHDSDEDDGNRRNAQSSRRRVRLHPQDRPRAAFTLREGIVIDTRLSRFRLSLPHDSYIPCTVEAARLLNIWAFARSQRIRGAYSTDRGEIDKVALDVRTRLSTLRASNERLPKWQIGIPGVWRQALSELELDDEHVRLLFDHLPNIPFVVPEVYKSISPFLLDHSLRTHGSPTALDAAARAERDDDLEYFAELADQATTWRTHTGEFSLDLRDAGVTRNHPDASLRRRVQLFGSANIASTVYRVGDVVLVLSPSAAPLAQDGLDSSTGFELPDDDDDERASGNEGDLPEDAVDAETKRAREQGADAGRSFWFARIESIFQTAPDDEDAMILGEDVKPLVEEHVGIHVRFFTTSDAIPSIASYGSLRQLFLVDSCETVGPGALIRKVDFQQLRPGVPKPPSRIFYCSSTYAVEDGSIQDVPVSTPSSFERCHRSDIAECPSCETSLMYSEATKRSLEPGGVRGERVAANDKVWTPIQLQGDEVGSFRFAGRHYHVNDFVLLRPAEIGLSSSSATASDRRNPLRLAQLLSIEHDPSAVARNNSRDVVDFGKNATLVVRWIVRRSETGKTYDRSTLYEREVFLTDVEQSDVDVMRLEGRFHLHHFDTVRELVDCDDDIKALTQYERDDPLNFFYTSTISRKDGTDLKLTSLERLDASPSQLAEFPARPHELVACRTCETEERLEIERRRRVGEALYRNPGRGYIKMDSLSLYSGGGGLDLGLGMGCKALQTKQAVEMNKEAASVFRANHEQDGVSVCAASDWLEDVFYGRRERFFFASITAGAPCQGFSSANLYKRVDDLRCLEPFVFLSALASFRPLFATFENVQGFLSHSLPNPSTDAPTRGSFFQKFISLAVELGYQVRWSLVNAAGFGVPQSRRRFVVQFALSGVPLPGPPSPTHAFHNATFAFDHHLREHDYVKARIDRVPSGFAPNPAVTVSQALDDLPPFSVRELYDARTRAYSLRPFGFAWGSDRGNAAKYPGAPHTSFQLQSRTHPRLANTKDVAFSRSATHHICSTPSGVYCERLVQLGTKGRDGKFGNYKDFEGLACAPRIPDWLERAPAKRKELFWSRLSENSVVATLRTTLNIDAASHGPRIHYDQARWLSLRELMRIQGLPDSFEMVISDAEPDTALADMIRIIGNGVPVPLAEAFGRSLAKVVYPLIDDHLSVSKTRPENAERLFETIWRDRCAGDQLLVDEQSLDRGQGPPARDVVSSATGGGGFARDSDDSDDCVIVVSRRQGATKRRKTVKAFV
ncbi:hypothetical protein JCM11491_000879 [Sporobolomyces phaffii]